MNFYVTFAAKTYGRAISFEGTQIGLDGVDLIRKETGVTELSPEKIYGSISNAYRNPDICLSEKEARASGHYRNVNDFTVYVKSGFINQFCEKLVEVDKSEKNGEIKSSCIKWKLNEAAVIAAWAEAGYPEIWECEEETNS